jgi:hypothetical protein
MISHLWDLSQAYGIGSKAICEVLGVTQMTWRRWVRNPETTPRTVLYKVQLVTVVIENLVRDGALMKGNTKQSWKARHTVFTEAVYDAQSAALAYIVKRARS